MRLQEIEADAQIAVPIEVGRAIKALAAGAAGPEQQLAAWRFIVDQLSGKDRMSFVLADDIPMVMAWREGRRFVGIQLCRIVETAIEPVEPVLPPARTMTERARRRAQIVMGPDGIRRFEERG